MGSQISKKILESPTFNAHQSSKLYGEGTNQQEILSAKTPKFALIFHHGMVVGRGPHVREEFLVEDDVLCSEYLGLPGGE